MKAKLRKNAPKEVQTVKPAQNTSPRSLGGWTIMTVCVFLALITLAIYGQTAHFDFINYDDNLYVYENQNVTAGLTFKGISKAFTSEYLDNWMPLTTISQMSDWQVFGPAAGGYHLTNVILHMASVIVLFLVLLRMTAKPWASAFVAAIFAVHPLHVESVAWVSERKDVLSGLFFILTLCAYIWYVRKPGTTLRYLAVIFLFALGLMSKPMLVTLPVIFLLLDYWPLNRFSPETWQKLIIEKIPLLALALIAGVLTLTVQGQAHAIRSLARFSLPSRLGNSVVSYTDYVGQMFYPAKLAVFYPYTTRPIWMVLGACAVLAGVTWAVFYWRRERPYLLVGWLWYLMMLAPVAGFIQVGNQAHADRYTYLPQIGLYLMVAWGVAELTARWRHQRTVLGALAGIVIAVLAWSAHAQTAYWRNSESLWTHALAVTSNNAAAEVCLGTALLQSGKTSGATKHFENALSINPEFPEAHANMGMALRSQGRLDEAIVELNRALVIEPDNVSFLDDLGNTFVQQGRIDDAIVEFQKALRLQPGDAETHNNLGNALAQKGDMNDGIAEFEKALELWPALAEAHFNLASALLQMGEWDGAISQFQAGLAIQPANAQAYNDLGAAMFRKGQIDEAVKNFRQALVLSPNYLNACVNLGNALRQQGHRDEAAVQFREALGIATAQSNVVLANQLQKEINLCRTNSP